MERRTYIRLLVGLGFGIPIALELATFLGLLESRLFGGDGGDDGGPTATPPPQGLTVGDEVLPATTPTDRLSTAIIHGEGERWTLTLTALVENSGTVPYELTLERVTTGSGDTFEGGASTGVVPVGESTPVTEQWSIPPGSTPRWLTVTARIGSGEGAQTVTERVPLADIAVSG